MTDPVTTNLSLTKPTPGADTDAWGPLLNTNWDLVDAAISSRALSAFKNLFINPAFAIWQRSIQTGSTSITSTTSGSYVYAADRWYGYWTGAAGGSITMAQAALTSPAGLETKCSLTWSSAAAAGNSVVALGQAIEGARREGAHTIKIKAKLNSGNGTFVVKARQCFGTGGSPSADVVTTSSPITLTGSIADQAVTVTLPSVAGATFGTNGNDYLAVELVSSNPTLAHNISLYGMEIEAAPYATGWERRPYGIEFGLCERYYQQTGASCSFSAAGAGHFMQVALNFRTIMRAAPSMSMAVVPGGTNGNGNVSSNGPGNITPGSFEFFAVSASAGQAVFYGWYFYCSAEII